MALGKLRDQVVVDLVAHRRPRRRTGSSHHHRQQHGPCVRLSVPPCVRLYVCLSVCLPVCLPGCLSVCLSASLSLCLWLSLKAWRACRGLRGGSVSESLSLSLLVQSRRARRACTHSAAHSVSAAARRHPPFVCFQIVPRFGVGRRKNKTRASGADGVVAAAPWGISGPSGGGAWVLGAARFGSAGRSAGFGGEMKQLLKQLRVRWRETHRVASPQPRRPLLACRAVPRHPYTKSVGAGS